jgi:hypothetical protein
MRVSDPAAVLSNVSACSQGRFRGRLNTGAMESNTQHRIQGRDAAFRLLNRLTTGAAVAALASVGVLGAVSASTIPGTTTSQTASTATSASTSTSISSSSSSGLGSSTTPVKSSSSGSGVVVSGGS